MDTLVVQGSVNKFINPVKQLKFFLGFVNIEGVPAS